MADPSLDYSVAKEYLAPGTHRKMRNQIGINIGSAVDKFEKEIRENQKPKDGKKFAQEVEKAAMAALREHLPIKDEKKMGSIAKAIVRQSLAQWYGVDARQLEKGLDDIKIDDYDNFRKGIVDQSKEQMKKRLYHEAGEIIEQHLKNAKYRGKLFDASEKDLGVGYTWHANARKSEMDGHRVAGLIGAGLEGELSKKTVETQYKNTLVYKAGK
ncbi:MAG: hypothetical protein ABIJ08_06925 [Nanoarchaeota archaeon]